MRQKHMRVNWAAVGALAVGVALWAMVIVGVRAVWGADCAALGKLCSTTGQGQPECCEPNACEKHGHWLCTAPGAGATTTTRVGATNPPATTPSTTRPPATVPPVAGSFTFPTACDVVWTIPRQQRCKFIGGHTATQPERLGMYWKGLAMMPEGLRFEKYHPACASVATGMRATDLESDDTRYRAHYPTPERNATFAKINECDDYEHAAMGGEDLQACATRDETAAVACAMSPYLTQDILDWADMRVEGGRCVKGGRCAPALPSTEDKVMQQTGILKYTTPLVVPAGFRDAARRFVEKHHAADHAFCAGTVSPGGVQDAAREMVSLPGLDPVLRNIGLVIFTGVVDPAWTREQQCQGKIVEGLTLTEWLKCLDVDAMLVKGCLMRTQISHGTIHRVMAFKNTKTVRFGNHVPGEDVTSGSKYPKRTGEAWLRCMTGETPGCRPSWVPVDAF